MKERKEEREISMESEAQIVEVLEDVKDVKQQEDEATSSGRVCIVGTVITGLDQIALKEVEEKFPDATFKESQLKGKVIWLFCEGDWTFGKLELQVFLLFLIADYL